MLINGPRFDESSEDKLWEHGLALEAIFQLFEEAPKMWRQRNGRYRVIGPDRSGRLITAVVEAPDEAGTMYVVTGWTSDKEEASLYRKPGGMQI